MSGPARVRRLGLVGVVQDGQLSDLCKGLDPATGDRLRRPPPPRTITLERINPFAGTRRIEQKKLAPVSGFDLVFSAPKSVSILHAVGDERTRRAISEAHIDAWQQALAYWRTRRASPAADETASSASTPAGSSQPPTSTAPAARRTRTCTPT